MTDQATDTIQQTRAHAFHALHVPGDPLMLFNVWDAGSAQAVEHSGAAAIATGSASVGSSLGYGDAEGVPIDEVLANSRRIADAVSLPVSIDFEGGYAVDPETVGANVARLIETGIVGINFEDQVIGGDGLHPIELQAERIAAIRAAADASGVALFINARTDVWLPAGRKTLPANKLLDEGLRRGEKFAEAGANGFFVPGLTSEQEIKLICKSSSLPINAMMFDKMPKPARLRDIGVARISYGPGPWRAAMAALTIAAQSLRK